MTSFPAQQHPVDALSKERLAAKSLVYRVIDVGDDAEVDAFSRADARGFLGDEPDDKGLAAFRETFRERRNVGVFVQNATPGALPVATVNSWVTPMTVPGGEIPLWAISSVTVSATHRRQGIARNLIEGELRAARDAGIAIAGLTVSEATIYRRYGFGSAVPMAEVTVDTHRAGWLAPESDGTIEYAAGRELADALRAVHEQERTQRAGQVPGWERRWLNMAGFDPRDSQSAAVRGITYRDADGSLTGALVYTLRERDGSFRYTLQVRHLAASTDEARRALWRFALTHDLVDRVVTDLVPLDDPLPWLVADQRAVSVRVHDHGWLRVLDVPAALSARKYRAAIDVVLRVDDPLGFAEGTWRLTVNGSGDAAVSATDATPDASLTVADLSSLYAGGVTAMRLRAASLLESEERVAAALDDAFRAERAPALSIWY